jgi:hypothetical protein
MGRSDLRDTPGEAGRSKSIPSFDLLFRPSIELITLVRRFVADFYTQVVQDQDTASRLALTTHELLENAVKYSTDGEAALYVELDPTAGTVAVRTRNRATDEQIVRVRRTFAEISAAPDAAGLYTTLLHRSAIATGSGGLGLARIWAESDMELKLVISDDTVEIQARGKIAAGD